ncbi:ADP-ribosylation factor 1-like, partial [Planoprotostelium fungivorum]
FRGAPLLVLANKMDLASASTAQVATRLGLDGWNDRHWHVEATSATHKTGVYEGFKWLLDTFT